MSGYQFSLTCPTCGDTLDHRDDTEHVTPIASTCEAWCSVCMVRYSVAVVVSVLDELNVGDWRERARSRAAGAVVDDGRKVFG